jgi:TM2 domain-containing membrane protein YozV
MNTSTDKESKSEGTTQPSASNPTSTGKAPNFYSTFFLGLFLGVFGAHRFYLSKSGTGFLQLITFGGFGIWWLVDMLTILKGKFKNGEGAEIPNTAPFLSWSVFAAVIIIALPKNSSKNSSSGSASTPSDTSYMERELYKINKQKYHERK